MSKLDDIKQQKSPYRVPEGYFADFREQLIDKVRAGQTEKQIPTTTEEPSWIPMPVRTFFRKWSFAGMAVLLVLAVSVPMFYLYQEIQKPEEARLQSALERIPTESVYSYVEEHLSEFSDDELAGVNEEVLAEMSIFDFSEEIGDEELIEYLLDNYNHLTITEDLL